MNDPQTTKKVCAGALAFIHETLAAAKKEILADNYGKAQDLLNTVSKALHEYENGCAGVRL